MEGKSLLTLSLLVTALLVSSGDAKRKGKKGEGLSDEGLNSIEGPGPQGIDDGKKLKWSNPTDAEPVHQSQAPPENSLDANSTKEPSKLTTGRPEVDEEFQQNGPSTFTVTSSEVGYSWDKLPFREKYQWNDVKAPCHAFKLQVPDERQHQQTITLCIFRPHLEFPDDTEQFIHPEEEFVENNVEEQKELKVYGYVKGQNGSHVYGKIVGTSFYGEVSVYDEETKSDLVYVVEEIKLLKKLMRNNEKILRNILSVMSKGSGGGKYNAVVTQGASLLNFMASVNPSEFVRGSFLVFSTSRNSYITAGEPMMEVDDDGKITFNAAGDKIVIDNEGHSSVHLLTGEREYIFRPNGKTVVQEGNTVDVLQENEGAVAVSAFTSESSYGCILPTPAFTKNRNGGYLCKVCIAVDKLFIEEYIKKLPTNETTISFLGRVIDNVSWIFRSTDWDQDGTPDNVGLDYDRQLDVWSYTDSGNETLTSEELDVLYGNLARMDFAQCCVAVGFTMKRFPGPAFAKNTAGPEKRGMLNAQNGVCGGQDTAGMSNNVILISGNSKLGNYSRMSEQHLSYLTGQQVARAFGAASDGTGDDVCDVFKDKNGTERHFLMWPDVLRDLSIEEKNSQPLHQNRNHKNFESMQVRLFRH